MVSTEPLVAITLVPVEVFGTMDCCLHGPDGDCPSKGYGLCDAVQGWSDCNRARGRIYRVEDLDGPREAGSTVTVYVPESEVAFFSKQFGDAE